MLLQVHAAHLRAMGLLGLRFLFLLCRLAASSQFLCCRCSDSFPVIHFSGDYHSSVLDVENLDAGQDFDQLPGTYADDMNFELMAERTRYLKENLEGVSQRHIISHKTIRPRIWQQILGLTLCFEM